MTIERARRDLVIANRILAREDVLDAYGHVSLRHPDDPESFLQSRSKSPQLDDLITFDLHGTPMGADERPGYLERFIHAAVLDARPEVTCVVHGHTEALLPFCITDTPLVPVIHVAAEMGATVPVWDIRDRFGDETNLLVTNLEQGRDLASTLAGNSVCLMRGHGFVAAGTSLIRTISMVVYLARNARVLMAARQLGEVVALSAGEIAAGSRTGPGETFDPDSPAVRRSWEYWADRAGCADLLDDHRG